MGALNRRFRLTAGIVRLIVPSSRIGTYTLGDRGKIHYVGRSDHCLRQRLLAHAFAQRDHYFDYNLQDSPEEAFIVESSLFHAHRNLLNKIHPAQPAFLPSTCPFCNVDDIRSARADSSNITTIAGLKHFVRARNERE